MRATIIELGVTALIENVLLRSFGEATRGSVFLEGPATSAILNAVDANTVA